MSEEASGGAGSGGAGAGADAGVVVAGAEAGFAGRRTGLGVVTTMPGSCVCASAPPPEQPVHAMTATLSAQIRGASSSDLDMDQLCYVITFHMSLLMERQAGCGGSEPFPVSRVSRVRHELFASGLGHKLRRCTARWPGPMSW